MVYSEHARSVVAGWKRAMNAFWAGQVCRSAVTIILVTVEWLDQRSVLLEAAVSREALR